jgi:hypothetical protein
MKVIAGLLIICMIQMGCSSSSQVSSFDEFNADAEGRSVTVELQDGENLEARNVLALPDSTRFWNVAANTITVLPTRTVKNVVMTNHLTGLLEGVGFGALGGSLAILAMGGGTSSEHGFGGGADVIGMILLGAAVGGVIGGIPGAIIGHSHTHQLAASPR